MKEERPVEVAREEDELACMYFLGQSDWWVLAICGLPGIGKTHFLRRCRERATARFPGACMVWLDGTNPLLRDDDLYHLQVVGEAIAPFCWAGGADQFFEDLARCRERQRAQHGLPADETGGIAAWRQALVEVVAPEFREAYARDLAFFDRNLHAQLAHSLLKALETFQPKQLVVFFDHCDWFVLPEYRSMGNTILADLLLSVHDRMEARQKTCRLPFGDPLRELQSFRDSVVLGTELQPLEFVQAERYLRSVGGLGPAERRYFYDVTRGNPQCLALVNALLQAGGDEVPASVDGLHSLFVSRWLAPAVLQDGRLPSPYRELVTYGALFERYLAGPASSREERWR